MRTWMYSFAPPQKPGALALIWALAFLPSILHLVSREISVTNSWTAFGPVVAGFWMAATFRELRVNFLALGTLITGLLLSANWLMMAGGTCCSTTNM